MKEKLLQIINHYGVLPQLKYFQSEVFELNEAIIKYESDPGLRLHADGDWYYIKKPKDHITEEIADVCVMLHQFVEYYGIDLNDIHIIMKQKIDRQLSRMKEE